MLNKINIYIYIYIHTHTHVYIYIYIYIYIGGARGVMIIVIENGLVHSCSNLERDCISHSAYILEKGMHPTFLSPAMGK